MAGVAPPLARQHAVCSQVRAHQEDPRAAAKLVTASQVCACVCLTRVHCTYIFVRVPTPSWYVASGLFPSQVGVPTNVKYRSTKACQKLAEARAFTALMKPVSSICHIVEFAVLRLHNCVFPQRVQCLVQYCLQSQCSVTDSRGLQ